MTETWAFLKTPNNNKNDNLLWALQSTEKNAKNIVWCDDICFATYEFTDLWPLASLISFETILVAFGSLDEKSWAVQPQAIKEFDRNKPTKNEQFSSHKSVPTCKSFDPRSFKQLGRIAFKVIFQFILFVHDVIDITSVFPPRRTAPLGLHFCHLSAALHYNLPQKNS